MTPGNIVQSSPVPARGSGRAVQIIVILLALISVVVFRVLHDRKRVSDTLKYEDMHESVDAMDDILKNTPPNERLATSLKYLNCDSPGLRYAAIDSLESDKGDGIADVLERAYYDSSTEVRKRALDLLPLVDVERGYRLQLAAIQDEDYWVRDHAMLLLSTNSRLPKTYVDRRAVPVLIHTMTDSDPNLVPLAIPILRRLTGLSGKEWKYSFRESDTAKSNVKVKWLRWWSVHRAAWPAKEFESLAETSPTRSDPAPDFLVRDIDGHTTSLDDLKGRVVLLNFWGTWCHPCVEEAKALVDLDHNYRSRGLVIIGVAVKEKSAASLRSWCQEHGVQYPQILDADSIAHVYGDCFEVPVTVLIDKNGMLRRRWDGERDYDTFRKAVEQLLKV